jgi:hypothetical protein
VTEDVAVEHVVAREVVERVADHDRAAVLGGHDDVLQVVGMERLAV